MKQPSTKSIALKLTVIAVLSLLVVMVISMGLVSRFIWNDFRSLSQREAHQMASQVRTLVASFDETAQDQARRDFTLFKSQFTGSFSVATQTGGDGKPEPVLSFAGTPLNGDFAAVDRFTKDSGGAVATIFARTGDDFMRVTTSLKKQDGGRAYKTLLDRSHPAYALMKEGKPYIGRASLFGREYMTVYEPIREGSETIGILFIGSDIAPILSKLDKTMSGLQLFQTGAVFAVNVSNGPARARVFGATDVPPVDEKTDEGKAWMAAVTASDQSTDFVTTYTPRRSADAGPRYVAVERYSPWGWAIVADAPVSEMMANARGVLLWLWTGVLMAVVLLVVALAWATRTWVGRPVRQLTDVLSRLAQGDLVQPVQAQSEDELGHLARSMEGFRKRLAQSLGVVRQSAHSVASASAEIAQGNQDLSSRTEVQASSLERTSASMEELRGTVTHNADSALQASQLAVGASQVATQGGDVVAQVVSTMHNINASSQKIADIIGVIDGIAFQTNILALNAAVEAARAGEQGRGFAVVASEVRNLAQRTANEARSIKELIGVSTAMVQDGAVLADKAGSTMGEVVASIKRVADMVAEISAASREQTSGMGDVAQALNQLDTTTQQNAALVEEMAASASSLRTQAAQMVEAVALFRLDESSAALRLER